MAKLFKTTFKLRRGATEVWEKNNPVLAYGEPGFDKDKYIFKIGDGKQHWKDLKPIGATVQADWNQNDETADDFIKNRLAWEESETIWEVTDTMEAWQFEGEKVFDIEEGSEYIVEIDDVSYKTKARTINIEGITAYFIGDGTLVPDTPVESTGEPFAIGVIPSEEIFVAFFFNPDNTKEHLSGTHTIRISKINVHKINPKFLPEKGFGYSETIDKVIFDSILEFVSEEEDTLGVAFAEYVELKDGENYIVYLDDMKYECTAFTFGFPGFYSPCLGNPGFISLDKFFMNDIPFIIGLNPSSEDSSLGIGIFDPAVFPEKLIPLTGEHSVKIIHKTNIVHKIDPMFYDQLGWKKEKYEPVFNIPVNFNSGEYFERFEAPFLQEGETYRVTYCGYVYEVIAEPVTYQGISAIGIGDMGFANNPPSPTKYPFAIGQIQQDSEYQTLFVAVEPETFPNEFIPLDGQFLIEIAHKKKTIQKIDPELYERLAWDEKEKKVILEGTSILDVMEFDTLLGLSVDNEYIVTYDGIDYRCKPKLVNQNGINAIVMGNIFIEEPDVEGKDELKFPFLVIEIFNPEFDIQEAGIILKDKENEHIISITEIATKIQKIDPKYLPEGGVGYFGAKKIVFDGNLDTKHQVNLGLNYVQVSDTPFNFDTTKLKTSTLNYGHESITVKPVFESPEVYNGITLLPILVRSEGDGGEENVEEMDEIPIGFSISDSGKVLDMPLNKGIYVLCQEVSEGTLFYISSLEFEDIKQIDEKFIPNSVKQNVIRLNQEDNFASMTSLGIKQEFEKGNRDFILFVPEGDVILHFAHFYVAHGQLFAMFSNIASNFDQVSYNVIATIDENGYVQTGENILPTVDYVDNQIASLVDSAPDELNTIKELADAFQQNRDVIDTLNSAITNKADKIFIAEYGTTLFNEIKEAYESGRQCWVKKGDHFLPFIKFGDNRIESAYLNDFTVQTNYSYDNRCYCININDNWSTLNLDLEKVINKVQTISESPSSYRYPSEKAVADAINASKKVATESEFGIVKAVAATPDMTEKVGIDTNGQLVTKPIGGNVLDYLLMKDAENGFTYVIEMRGGNLVSSAMCTGIRITKAPDKVDYIEGDLVDVTGIVVEAVYEDGSVDVINGYTYSEIAPANGTLVVSWIYKGSTYTASMKLNVTTMAEILVDFEYMNNGDGTYTLTDWKGTLNGKASTEIIVPDNNRIIV